MGTPYRSIVSSPIEPEKSRAPLQDFYCPTTGYHDLSANLMPKGLLTGSEQA